MSLTCHSALGIIAPFPGPWPGTGTGNTLANIRSAQKRARQAVRRRTHNVALRSRVRTAMRAVLKAVQAGDKDAAQACFKQAVPEIDRMVNKGIIKKNRGAQYKSRLNAKLLAMP